MLKKLLIAIILIGLIIFLLVTGLAPYKENIKKYLNLTPTSLVTPTNPPSGPIYVEKIKIKQFLIALNDNGKNGKKIGCGDSAVFLEREVKPTPQILSEVMKNEVNIQAEYLGDKGYFNSLYKSKLNFEKAVIENGKATLYFTGSLSLGGVCDGSRVKAQLEETALQFPTVKSVEIFISGKDLNSLLSGKGE